MERVAFKFVRYQFGLHQATVEQHRVWHSMDTVLPHMTGTDIPRSFDELVKATQEYDLQWNEPGELVSSVERCAVDLVRNIEAGNILVVKNEE